MPSRLFTRILSALAVAVACACAAAPLAAGAGSIAGTRAEIDELGRDVASLDIQLGAAVAANNAAADRLDAASDRLARTRTDLSGARRDLEQAQTLLAERLVALYVNRPPTFVELLIQTGSLQEAEAADDLLGQIARGDASVLGSVRGRRARLERLEQAQADAESHRRRELEETQDRQAEVGALLEERRQVLAGARSELKRLIKEDQERRRRLAALAAARTQYLQSLPVAGGAALGSLPSGSYLFPVAGETHFTNDFGYPRPGGRSHEGIDLFAARGTPIVAVADGRLDRVGWNTLGGWRLWLHDGSGNAFYFAHLSAYSPAAREGAAVTRGTVLGFVGDSGDAQGTPTHLHFEVHPGGGGPVPPYPIITGWPRAG